MKLVMKSLNFTYFLAERDNLHEILSRFSPLVQKEFQVLFFASFILKVEK